MPLRDTGRTFVEMCNELRNFDVMRTMYAPAVVSVEADGAATAGRKPFIRKSEAWQADDAIRAERARGPFFNKPDPFAVHFTFDVARKAIGTRGTIGKVGVYTVTGACQVTRERFFYDGEH